MVSHTELHLFEKAKEGALLVELDVALEKVVDLDKEAAMKERRYPLGTTQF